jgi:hypothetical protein
VRATAAAVLIAFALASCGRRQQAEQGPAVHNVAGQPRANAPAGALASTTPMAQRVAVLGILNKRNGIVKDVTLHPGQSVRWQDVLVRLRACETTAPWEEEKLTGAFVQVDVQKPDRSWNRVFSGWLYKESPSLNVVENRLYDVWPKSCAMTYPAGPGAPAAPETSSNRSSAEKSGGPSGTRSPTAPPRKATPASPPPPSDAANNPT